jgi:hypothetical protein
MMDMGSSAVQREQRVWRMRKAAVKLCLKEPHEQGARCIFCLGSCRVLVVEEGLRGCVGVWLKLPVCVRAKLEEGAELAFLERKSCGHV